MSNYERVMAKLLKSGWTPDQGVPEELIMASQMDQAGAVGVKPAPTAYPEGSMENPMELSTMNVTGSPPQAPQAGGGGPQAPQAGAAPPPRPGIFEGMSDEDADRYAGMGDLERQMGVAEGLRTTEDAKGYSVNQGRTFVAANPLEHLVVGLKRRKGKKETDRLGGEQTKGRRSIIDLLRNRDKDDFTEDEVGFEFEESDTRVV